jgi:hypothetical protein
VLVAATALWLSGEYWLPAHQKGFSLVTLQDNSVLVSDSDVLSFNVTSQEFVISDAASQRLMQNLDSLYQFNNTVVIRVNGEEIYHGIFRAAWMSAVPSLPKVAILFPSMHFPDGTENSHAIRLFYPNFQPATNQSSENAKLVQYFEDTNRLIQ